MIIAGEKLKREREREKCVVGSKMAAALHLKRTSTVTLVTTIGGKRCHLVLNWLK